MIAVLKTAAPDSSLRLPPFSKYFVIFRLIQIHPISEKVQIDSEPYLVAAALASIRAAWISVSIPESDFESELSRLQEKERNHHCELLLLIE
jgi:hypothetical protein